MTSRTSEPIDIDYPFEGAPPPGTRAPVVDGLDWVRLPLPFRLDHVNCWWLDGGAGERVQVDTGIASITTRGFWAAAFDGARPDALLVTHFHPDHSGLAGELGTQGVALYGSEIEMTLAARIHANTDADYGALYADWYRRNGLDAATVEAVAGFGNGYRRITSTPPEPGDACLLVDGDTLSLGGRDWQVWVGEGHAPAMLMLFDPLARVLIAADQVLPAISPNVSCAPEGPDGASGVAGGVVPDVADPLARFLATLERLRALPADTLVLPSHGLPFRGLHARIDALVAHHDARLAEVLGACAEPRCAAELFPLLFGRKLDAQQTSFALGEALAHLRHLEARGELVRIGGGLDHYVRAAG